MERCWAQAIGGCGSKLSREHYVSGSLWPDANIEVVGLNWCRTEPRRVGLGSLTAHILCDVHNAGLSPADSAAGAAFETLRRMMALNREREASRHRKWKLVRHEIDGPSLERWFLKTAINIACIQKTKDVWYIDRTPLATPGVHLINWAFGNASIEPPFGLYVAASSGVALPFQDAFEAGPLYYFDQGVIGFRFVFYGVPFLLWLAQTGPPSPLPIPWSRGTSPSTRDLHRHLRYVRCQVGRHISHYVDFMWPDQPAASWVGAT